MSATRGVGTGIPWRNFEDTAALMGERTRPVLALVLDPDGTRLPFLRALFDALPRNARLCELLSGQCAAMLLKADSIPGELALTGAGTGYHVAVLAPAGFTPLVTFNYAVGKTDALVDEIARVLETLAPQWA